MRIAKVIAALPTLVLGLTLMSGYSHAQLYMSGNIGALVVQDSERRETGPGFIITGEYEFDTGLGANGAIGYAFDNLRIEGELSYRQADIGNMHTESVTIGAVTTLMDTDLNVDGEIWTFGLMANAWYDFYTNSRWVPFIGGGVGSAQANARFSFVGIGDREDDDVVFAYQVGAGTGFRLTDNTLISLGYRFFGTDEAEFSYADTSITETIQIQSHNFEIGIRHIF